MARKLLALNECLGERGQVGLILLSRNSSDTGLQVFNSIRHYGLNITRAAFTGGCGPLQLCLCLRGDPSVSLRWSEDAGCAAATILPLGGFSEHDEAQQLRIAFDGDAGALFRRRRSRSTTGTGWRSSTPASAPLPANRSGRDLSRIFWPPCMGIQSLFPVDDSPLRTALITARGAPSHERIIRTLRAWGIRIDESLFLGGLD